VLGRIGRWGDGPEEYRWPLAMTADAEGTCYIADRSYNRVQVYDAKGYWIRSMPIPGPIDDSIGLTIDPFHHLIVPHFTIDCVFCLSPDGAILTGADAFASDPLDSTRTHRPRFAFFPDDATMWITNGDLLYAMKRIDPVKSPAGF
ncbi:hypothetical protein JXA80_01100, partial [bacterium]|nr:hypothetical protein [candidate division CSSED10-310 bacterium]